jgi:MFS transporter, DHA3 family, macrolide efflux protein
MSGNTLGSVLRARRFAMFAAGQTVSQLGDKLDQMALVGILGTLRPGGSGAFAVAELAVAFTLPAVLFGPVAGVLVDRWNRRRTLIACDVLRAGLVVLIPLAYRAAGALWAVYPIVFAVFLVGLVFNAAKMAVLPDLVGAEQLLAANAAVTFIGRFATVAGIVGGGIVVGASLWSHLGCSGYEAGFYLDALSFAASAWTLNSAIPASRVGRQRTVGGATVTSVARARGLRERVSAVAHELADARRLIAARPPLRFVFASVGLVAAASGSLYVLAVIIIQVVMRLGTSGLGIIGGIGAAGMIAGSYTIGVLGSRWPKARTILTGCASAGLLLVWLGSTLTLTGLAFVSFLVGALAATVVISQDTWLHQVLPAGARGRVFALRDLLTNGAFGAAAVGTATALAFLERSTYSNPHGLVLGGTGGLMVLLAWGGRRVIRRGAAGSELSAVQ